MVLALILAAAPLTVGPDYAGFEQTFTLKTDSDLGKKGMNDCGFHNTTSAPVLTFTVTSRLQGFVLELANTSAGGVLVRGKQHLCLDPGVTEIEDPATYALYLVDSNEHAFATSATVRLGFPARLAKNALAATKVMLDGSGKNPLLVHAPKQTLLEAARVGVSCAKNSVRPVALLEVTADSTYTVASGTTRFYVVKADGTCAPAKKVELTAGKHELWADAREEALTFTIRDTERAREFGGTPPVLTVSTLPAVIRVTTAKETEQRFENDCHHDDRTPSFILEAGELDGVTLEALTGASDVTIDVLGKGGDVCNRRETHIDHPGRAFVFVSSKNKETDVLIGVRGREEISPVWRSNVPDAPPEVSDRALHWHFPYWRRTKGAVTSIFNAAPAGLFVFVTKEREDLSTTEPLLLLGAADGKATLLRMDGAEFGVRLSALTTEVPAKLTFSPLKPYVPATTSDEAWSNTTTEDATLLAAWRKKEDEHRACVGRYMRKNDPSWGKSYELIYVRSGRNVSEVMFKQADAACGFPKLEKVRSKFVTDVNNANTRRRGGLAANIKKKLGR